MIRAVRYERFGGPEVLDVVEVEPPRPGPGEVRVDVVVAGLNPADYKIFDGSGADRHGVWPPAGVGHDFAGVIDEVGENVTRFAVGDQVYGGKRAEAMADYVIIHEDDLLIRRPDGLAIEVAGALAIAGRTACAGVDRLDVTAEDTVLVGGAAGGVGVIAAQLALLRGAVVIGTASEKNHDFLRELGVIPITYGDGLVDRIRDASPDGVTAAFDTHGGTETIDAALEFGVDIERVNTIAARGHREAQGAGSVDASREDLARLGELIAAGEVVIPIDCVYPIERVAEAYEFLMAGHLRGKVIVVTR
ncbi:NADP-dependent oxidoreductase [Humibacter soli]